MKGKVYVVYTGAGSTDVPGLGRFIGGKPRELSGRDAELGLILIKRNENFKESKKREV